MSENKRVKKEGAKTPRTSRSQARPGRATATLHTGRGAAARKRVQRRIAQDTVPECWRISRVARVLDVSTRRVYNLIGEGRLEAVRLGPRQIRVFKDSLEDYLNDLRRREMEGEM